MGDMDLFVKALIAFIAFCLTSSSIYCINDSIDAPYDAVNPDKRHRPVASGAVSRGEAIGIAFVLLLLMVALLLGVGTYGKLELLLVLLLYYVLNLAYSLWLKRIPLLDILSISIFFLLRVCAGGIACGIPLTEWTMVLVFLLTLMLAAGKRRHEVWLCETYGIVSRKVVARYKLKFLNIFLICIGLTSMGAYVVWACSEYAVERYSSRLVFTSLFVAVGISRYLSITLRDNDGGNPIRLLFKDRMIQLAVVCWLACFAYFLYYSS